MIMAPFGTELRRMWLEGWVFIRLGDNLWYHCGLVYLQPQRVTYLRAHLASEREDGQCELYLRLDEAELPEVLHEVDLAKSLDLSCPLRIRLYKLQAWQVPHTPFSLGLHLTIQALHLYLPMVSNDVRFWKGSHEELADERARRLKQATLAAERRRKAAAKAAPAGGVPPAAGGPRVRHRRQPRPPDAGLLPIVDVAAAIADLPEGIVAGAALLAAEDLADIPGSAACLDVEDDPDADHGDLPGVPAFRRDWQASLLQRDEGY